MKLGLLLSATVAFAADPRLVYTKSFPGSTPAYVAITVEKTGATSYREVADDDPETFQLETDVTASMFDLAEKLGHFKTPLDSGLKVAFMGDKTFRWENGTEISQQKFNYSMDENARLMQDWFERITESEALAFQLRRTIRYDRLGANEATSRLQIAYDKKRLVGLAQLIPMLERIAGNESFMNIARERCRQLAAAFKEALKPGAVQ